MNVEWARWGFYQRQKHTPSMATMFNTGKCPKCEKVLNQCSIENITASAGIGGPGYKAVSYSCGYCHTILSVQMDPVSLEADLTARLLKALERR
jgi:hypothetical protein